MGSGSWVQRTGGVAPRPMARGAWGAALHRRLSLPSDASGIFRRPSAADADACGDRRAATALPLRPEVHGHHVACAPSFFPSRLSPGSPTFGNRTFFSFLSAPPRISSKFSYNSVLTDRMIGRSRSILGWIGRWAVGVSLSRSGYGLYLVTTPPCGVRRCA